MPAGDSLRVSNVSRVRSIKIINAWTALVAGGALLALAVGRFGFSLGASLLGLLVGLFYANLFEYVFHRFLLHTPGKMAEFHDLHHSTWGGPDESLYILFAKQPWVVVLLFVVNSLPFFVLEWLLHPGIAPGVEAAFTIYFIAYEEIHWRFHVGGWLPGPLLRSRQFHLDHHVYEQTRFNVFLPLGDWLFHTSGK